MALDNVGSIEFDSRISTDRLRKDAADVDRIAKRAGDDLADHTDSGSNRAGESLKKFAKIAAVALAATGAAAVAFGVSSAKAFIESENAIAQTEAVLKSTNQVAGVTSKTVTDLANSLQRQTRYSDETIRSAENMLLTFTNISKKTFPGATQAVLDMATAMGTDLQSTAIQVGKALQDPVLGATALQRVGVRLTESQKDLIKSLVASGDAAGAQAVILKELQTEFGGSAVAAGKTFAGRLDILKNQLGEVQEGIGALIVVGIGPLVSWMLKWYDSAGGVEGIMQSLRATLDSITPQLQQWWSNITNVANAIGNYLGPKLTALWNTISVDLIPAVTRFWKEVIQPLIPVLGTALVIALGLVIDQFRIWAKIVSFVYNIISGFANFITSVVVPAIQIAIDWISEKFTYFKNHVGEVVASIIGFFVTLPIMMPIYVAQAVAKIISVIASVKWSDAFAGIWQGMQAVWDKVLSIVNSSWQRIKDIKWGDLFTGIGKSFANGLIDLIENALRGALKGLPGNVEKKINLPRFASGTDFAPGGASIVGERGPEIVNLPRGAQVIPNHDLDSFAQGSSNNNVNVTLNLSGIMARSTSDLRDIGKDMLRSINQELAAKQIPLIGDIT